MKLHTVFISYNRLELTKQAVESFLSTVTLPFSYAVVDNGSFDGTREWLTESEHPHLLLGENRYPGFACNRGWELATSDVRLLQRCDNDFLFLPDWCAAVLDCLSDPAVGQVGLRTDEEENYAAGNVGGNCIIRRALWQRGLRWDERPWGQFAQGYAECADFSAAVSLMGYQWRRVSRPIIHNLASGDWDDPYYAQSYGVRGIVPDARRTPGTL